jgi:hypothetical protein
MLARHYEPFTLIMGMLRNVSDESRGIFAAKVKLLYVTQFITERLLQCRNLPSLAKVEIEK